MRLHVRPSDGRRLFYDWSWYGLAAMEAALALLAGVREPGRPRWA